MIKKFLEYSDSGTLKYYAFDWDDNVLMMPTVIHMEHLIDGEWTPEDVSTADFAIVRKDSENWRILKNDPNEAFSEFRDFGPRGDKAFLEDVKKAVSMGKLGPAWDDFIECLVNGSIFALITARGHEIHPMRMGVEFLIDNLEEDNKNLMYNNLLKFAYLFKEEGEFDRILKTKPSENPLVKLYLDKCDFIGVSSPSRGGSPANPEKAKEDALLYFKDKINRFAKSVGVKAEIGFSDDDLSNVKHIEDLVDSIHNEQFPEISHMYVKGTNDPENITKKVRVFEHNDPLASSVLPFTQFNNMTNRLYPTDMATSQDDYLNKFRREVKYLAKTSKEAKLKEKKKK